MADDRGYEIINPPNKLKQTVGPKVDLGSGELLARADAAMRKAAAAVDLADDADEYLARLRKALADVGARQGGDQTAAITEIYNITHDLRGQGTTFGYPLVTRVARSLNHYLENRKKLSGAEADVVKAHVDALTVVLKNRMTGDGGAVGEEIASSLESIVGL